jgi:hypothetical protein
MFLGSKVRPVRRANNLTAIYEPISRQCGILKISQPYRPGRPVLCEYKVEEKLHLDVREQNKKAE